MFAIFYCCTNIKRHGNDCFEINGKKMLKER